MSRETLIASLQRLASLLCVKSFGQCHISQTSTITLEWRFQYLLSLNHNIGAGLSQREVLDRRSENWAEAERRMQELKHR
ncbi:hypothetical protein T03_3911 [Trichinella britovi]|uniref:Uncharacterized protein n=2 Tax=Trichinella TaxID=6333 RepID=A0A0V1DHW2_TRIBR|nr:hypothetical protein T05_8790 [Trichinella murrelli]KRX68355.1 hypothetical protein T09_9979 [Trichinella sp. T9]KRX82631.1 hypothetical protein T06_1326 [Trichinella sp. T6]KRY60904.1 hypothetical protein T03_3911 [Trichinella britovi]